MNEVVHWQSWLKPYERESGYPFVARSIAALVANEKSLAVWISGSRAIHRADEHSDIDIRVHAPTWEKKDLANWLNAVDPTRRPLVRTSCLSSTQWNYECLFAGSFPIDLLVFTADKPLISADSAIFKNVQSLEKMTTTHLIKESEITPTDICNLVDGAMIDQRKFTKLLVRGERLSAWFLLDVQRFTILRLRYIAASGMDCGDKNKHTLASLKRVREIAAAGETATMVNDMAGLSADGTLEELIAQMEVSLHVAVAKLCARVSWLLTENQIRAGPGQK